MARYKIIYLLLLAYYSSAASEEAEDRILIKPPDKLQLHKSAPYQKEESFLSKIGSWFFPSSDSVPAEGRYGGPQYLPPQPYQSQTGCNPCNKAPWIPVASNLGHHTIINFVPPSSHLEDLRPPTPEYGPPPPPIFKPKRQKAHGNYIQYLRPPPVTHLQPVNDYEVPIGMRPPPLDGHIYESLPPTLPTTNIYLPPPSPPPSDSYGAPIKGPNAHYQIRPEYLPPVEQLPLATNIQEPIPLPNLHSSPVLPIRNPQNFHSEIFLQETLVLPTIHAPPRFQDSVPQQGTDPNVQIVPSVNVAGYLHSVEHPIKVIQSPLVEVSVKQSISEGHNDVRPGGYYNENPAKLSENPIVVEDTHVAASAVNVTFQDSKASGTQTSFRAENHDEFKSNLIKQLLQTQNQTRTFAPPPLDYSKWEPKWSSSLAGTMVPPPVKPPTTWLQPVPPSTTKRPKEIQIIVPYISSKKPIPFNKNVGKMVPSKPYSTLLPVYAPPSSTEEIWSKFIDDFKLAESKRVTATAFTVPTTQVYNIRDLLRGTKGADPSGSVPFDIVSLRNNIDDWTQQEYAKVVPTSSSKKIPERFLPTQPFTESTTTPFDHEPSGSNKKETALDGDIESNLIFKETTTEVPTTTTRKFFWDVAAVTVSPVTKEKLYVITPQPPSNESSTPVTSWSLPPKIPTIGPAAKFLIRVDPEDKASREKLQHNTGAVTVVFSEWPHLINNLQTTSSPPAVKHPLLGLMDLAPYTPPANSTVQTIAGHSKVAVVTSTTKKGIVQPA